MSWIVRIASLFIKEMAPWIWGLVASGITWIASFVSQKMKEKREAEQREKATKELEDAINNKVPREERQKKEEDLLNS